MKSLFPIRPGDVPRFPEGAAKPQPQPQPSRADVAETDTLLMVENEERQGGKKDKVAKKEKKDARGKKTKKKKDKKKTARKQPREELDPAALQLQMLEENRAMNERLSGAEAHSVERWLAFADAQSRYFVGEALRTRRQGILEQAIAKNPNEHRLYLELLQIEGLVENRGALFDLYQKVLVKFNSVPSVVVAFLRFLKSRHWASVNHFAMSDVRRCYAVALHCAAAAGRENEVLMQRLFEEMVEFEHLAGYSERAVALFQALIEFNSVAESEACNYFGSFWSSGAPRIGDANYGGGLEQWLRGSRNAVSSVSAEEDDFAALLSSQKWSLPVDWSRKEWQMSSASNVAPVAGDADTLVTVEDVAPFLFRLADVESIGLLLLSACGVKVFRPSMWCDEPALEFGRSDFAFGNGGNLIVPANFAANVCEDFMGRNSHLFCVLRMRCAVLQMENVFEVGARLLSEMRTSYDLFCELADCCLQNGNVSGATRVAVGLPNEPMVYALRAMLQLTHNVAVSLPTVAEAALALKQAVEDQVPRSVLYACLTLGVVLLLNRQLREAISCFESGVEALGGCGRETVSCRALLLEAYLKAMEVAEGLTAESRQSVLCSVAGTALRIAPTSDAVLQVLHRCRVEDARALLDGALRETPHPKLFVLASEFADVSAKTAYLESGLGHDRHCLTLWLRYWEACDEKGREKVLCRALRAMPWSKTLWLKMIDCCEADDDKRELYRLMVLKQIHVRHAMK